jgi:DNA-directed RNA polymerase specialized sigma24 family protein
MESTATDREWNWLNRAIRSTRWTLVRLAGRALPGDQARAADEFCRHYWYPLYAFLRHSGYSQADSQDHVQSFLVHVLDSGVLARADPEKGRLRNFLITLLTRHVSARRDFREAKKRGGGAVHVPLDWESAETSFLDQGRNAGSPDEAFRRVLATRLVSDGIAALRRQYEQTGRMALFDELLPALEGSLPDATYAEVAERLGMRPGAVRSAAVRFRERFRLCVKSSAASLLGIPDGPRLDGELKELFCTNQRPASL